jgi:hypothetical protein
MRTAGIFQFLGNASNGYSVFQAEADGGKHVGFVARTKDGKSWEAWRNGYSVTDASNTPKTFRTRGEAASALLPIAAVEWLAREHWKNATSEDRSISAGDSPIYLRSQTAVLGGIAAAYPDMVARDVYNAFIDHGETVVQTVNAMREERKAWAVYQAELEAEDIMNAAEERRLDVEAERIRAEWEAEAETAHASVVESPEAHEVPEEREITIDISRDGAGFMVTMVTVYPEAVTSDGFTRNGTPLVVTRAAYTSLKAARAMVDVMTHEFASNPDRIWAAYTVTLVGLASLSSRLSVPSEVTPTYRTAGFPSLDAAIGAGYALANRP